MKRSSDSASLDFSVIESCVDDLESKQLNPLKDYFWKGREKEKKHFPEKAGVYIFWWTGNLNLLLEKLIVCQYELKGPSNRKERIIVKFSKEWIERATINNSICLYVGKSTNIRKRITSHIKPNTLNIWSKQGNENFSFHKKPNTTSQLRIGLERVFKNHSLEIIKNNISISWIELEGDKNAINRFYIENKIISHYYALFNIDIER
ncbi:GIY-YIG nuclease family protein [Xanthomarina gelatinilytica]|uniref:GIY-YIG nuclease family protein n=1 Tax=Xanthomarina gelatinilytica TaxID=1137281 RepID=UPI003AA8E556